MWNINVMKITTTTKSLYKSNIKMISNFKAYSRISGVLAFAIGFIVLIGWIFNIMSLKSLQPSFVSMKANTAIAIMLAGMSLWFIHYHRKTLFHELIFSFCAALVTAIGLLSLIEYIGSWNFGIDQLLFTEPIGTVGTYFPGRMAINTAFCFSCLGTALLLMRSRSITIIVLSQLLSAIAALVTITALIGYFYNINEFYGYVNFTKMALHTAFILLILSTAVICAIPDHGIMIAISGNDFSGFLLRRLLPAAIVIPILIGWLRLEGERHEFFGSSFGVLMVAVVYIILFILLIWKVARSLNRFDLERSHAEEELQFSETRYRRLFESAKDGILILDADTGKIVDMNPFLIEMLGYSHEELLGKELWEIGNFKNIDTSKNAFIELQKKEFIRFENMPLETKSGKLKNVEFVSNVYLVDHKKVVQCNIRDITDRKQAEETIRMNEARLESLLKISQYRTESKQELLDFALDEAIALTESKIGYIYFYDDKKQEFKLNTWSKEVMNECTIIEPQTIYQLEKTGIWGEAVRQKKPIVVNDFPAPNPLKKGYPEGHAQLLKYLTIPVFSDGRIVAVVAVANKETDYIDADVRQLTLLMDNVWQISERRHAERELLKLSRAVEQSPASIVITDTTGAIEYVNPKFIQLTGYSLEEAVGQNPRILKSGEKSSEEYKQLWEMITTGKEWLGEFHNKKKNGELYWESAVISPITNAQGVIINFLAVKEDITQRKQNEAEREKLINELQEALADVKTLSGLIPICATCKKIRDDNGYWQQVEAYIQKHSDAKFTHGICPDCMKKLYPEFVKYKKE